MTPESLCEVSDAEDTFAVQQTTTPAPSTVSATPPPKAPRHSRFSSSFQWEEQSYSAFDLPGLANDAEAAETTMITSQGYPGLESPGLEAVRNSSDLSFFGATPIASRVASQ